MALEANGIKEGVDIVLYRAEDGMMGAHKEWKVYINLAYQDGSVERLNEVLGDELSHGIIEKEEALMSIDR